MLKGLVVSGHLTVMYFTQTVDRTEVYKFLDKKASAEDGGATARWRQVTDRVNNSCPDRPKLMQRNVPACRSKFQQLMALGVAYIDGNSTSTCRGGSSSTPPSCLRWWPWSTRSRNVRQIKRVSDDRSR